MTVTVSRLPETTYDPHPEPVGTAAADDLPQHQAVRECVDRMLGTPCAIGVDVGCGSGAVVAALGERGVPAIGVDPDLATVRRAAARFPGGRYQVARPAHLPFRTGSLGWYRACQVLQYSDDPAGLLGEARRVVAAGGRIVLADRDLDTWAMDADDEAMTRILVRGLASALPNSRAGTRAVAMLLDAGFVEARVRLVPLVYDRLAPVLADYVRPAVHLAVSSGTVSPETARAWLADQQRRSATGRFLMTMSMFVTTATAP
jgi:SAM-dependent methyltransferase